MIPVDLDLYLAVHADCHDPERSCADCRHYQRQET